MMKFKTIWVLFFVMFITVNGLSQIKVERQHRIKKSQFPSKALHVIDSVVRQVKRLKFYREVDTAATTYTAKFKKDRLFYEMGFTQDGRLNSIAFKVKQIDVPGDSYQAIENYLNRHFEKSKTLNMLQSYPIDATDSDNPNLRIAFQNLMVPNMNYRLLVRGKRNGKSADYTLLFDADGNFIAIKKSLPMNYDRVLY